MSTNEIIRIANKYSLVEKLKIVEAILKNIREDSLGGRFSKEKKNKEPELGILKFAGILNDEEASVFENAIEESRKIDKDEW